MSDTWSSIQAHKKQLDNLRERLQRRRKDTGALGLALVPGTDVRLPDDGASCRSDSPGPAAAQSPGQPGSEKASDSATPYVDPGLERHLLNYLSDVVLPLPVDSSTICHALSQPGHLVPMSAVESLLEKFAAQELIAVRHDTLPDGRPCLSVTDAEHSTLGALLGVPTSPATTKVIRAVDATTPVLGSRLNSVVGVGETGSKRKIEAADAGGLRDLPAKVVKKPLQGTASAEVDDEIARLLSQQSTKERESKKVNTEILQLLSASTAKEQSTLEKFRSRGGAQVQEFCEYGTKQECVAARDDRRPCCRLHFRRIINKHTEESLGDCSFLNTCFHMDTCKFVHYEIDHGRAGGGGRASDSARMDGTMDKRIADVDSAAKLFPPQWINCDIRFLDMSTLGKFSVVMADPPWDIHMELPYGTLSDDELRRLNIPVLQDDGYIFLWVTGRAMENGRECLKLWGYERVDELIWVKTNQLQRIIRTGRTGHWLNHGKEHCLVGAKGNLKGFNRGLDCDVLVAEVRSTSHKPDEIYGIIERLSPGTRKIEMFGRPHNVQPNWITLGNQLDGIHLLDPEVVARFKKRYPDGVITKPKAM
uniref:N6-adenosine-methyltransferase catalytic subunit n=1 Tax=Myxine glutinosa TaxID=7769 RepID=UPI00358E8AAA